MSKKIDDLLSENVDLSALPHHVARYVEELRGIAEDARREKAAVINNRLGLNWSPKSYDDRFDDWLDDAVVPVLDAGLSRPEGDTGNLIIEGDNIDALRVLARTHKGKVDCVFIDPPYNTESTTFVYNDDYVASEDKYRYSMWLEGLKRRLRYVPDLLSDRGVLLVAINDKNRSYVDLFIRENIMPGKFKGSFVWRSRQGKNDPGNAMLSVDHEHVLIYANDDFAFVGRDKTFAAYTMNDHDGRGVYEKGDLTVSRTAKGSPLSYYHIQNPDTDVWYPCNPDRVWFVASRHRLKENQKVRLATMEDLIADNRVWFPEGERVQVWKTREELDAAITSGDVPRNGKGVPLIRHGLPDLDFFVGKKIGWGIPRYKRYKEEMDLHQQPLTSWINSSKDLGTEYDEGLTLMSSGFSSESEGHLKSMLGEQAFSYAKPLSLMMNLVAQSTSRDSVVLDFYAGSGTTAEAVIRVNADDEGSRRFVLVSSRKGHPDDGPDVNLCRDKTAARVNAVIDGFTKGKTDVEGTGGGYAYLRMERHPEEVICGPMPFRLSIDMAFTLCQVAFGLPAEAIDASNAGYAVRETDDAVLVFAPAWSKGLVDAVKAEFDARPGKDHVLLSDLDQTPTAHLRNAGCASAKCLDAIVFAGRLCGPAAFFQRSV